MRNLKIKNIVEWFKNFSKSEKYGLIILVILGLALVLRVYNFSSRWGLGGDDARDAVIGREALVRGELPLIGPFSSAGPFVFGPMFYWFITFSYALLPSLIVAPWVINLFVGLLTILVLVAAAFLVADRRFAIIVGLLSALSPQLVIRSLMLGNPGLVAITTSLLILNFVLFWQRKALKFAFFMGISLGFALSMHYQALNLFIFFPLLFLVPSLDLRKKLLALLLMAIGFVLPSLPLLIWDSRQEWANIRNLLDYFLIGQYRLYVPNSWRLFLFDYFPNYWSFVVGGNHYIGLMLMVLTGLIFFILTLNKKIKKELLVLGLAFFIMAFLNRYYRGERSEGYLLYFAPFILIFSASAVNKVWELSRFLGLVLLTLVLLASFLKFEGTYNYDNGVKVKKEAITKLVQAYPDTRFTLFDYRFESFNTSSALSLLMNGEGLTSKYGYPLGVVCREPEFSLKSVVKVANCSLVDLAFLDESLWQQGKTDWGNVNPEGIYDSLIGWSKTHKLTSSFSLEKYLKERLENVF